MKQRQEHEYVTDRSSFRHTSVKECRHTGGMDKLASDDTTAVADTIHAVPDPAGRSLRVTLVTETWPPEINGVALTVHRLFSGLGSDHHLSLIRVRQGNPDRGLALPGVQTHVLPGFPLPRYPGLNMGLPHLRTLQRLWRHERPDVVHVVTEGPLGWASVRTARRLGIPVISGFHTNFHQYVGSYGMAWLKPLALRYLRRLHNRTQMTLVPTLALAEQLRQEGFHNLQVLARGVDNQAFHPQWRNPALRATWGAAPDAPVLLTVGRIAPEKNLQLILDSFRRVQEHTPSARLVIVGDGPSRASLAQANPDVYFPGMQTGQDLSEHYASADLFVFPSLSETFGNVTLEAMASGLAVVAFDYAAAREHIRDGVVGRCVPFGDAGAFSDAVDALVRQPALIRTLGQAARTAAQHIDWSQIRARYAALLHACLENGHG